MRGVRYLTLAAVVAVAAGGGTPARAGENLGSAAILTNRNCTQAPTDPCVLGARIFTQYAGGMFTGFSTSASNMNGLGASASASVSFSDSYLPVMRVGSFSGAATRTGASLSAFRTFTYTGDRAINLALTGALDYVSTGDPVGFEMYNEGTLDARLAFVSSSYLSVFTPSTTATQIVNSEEIFAACGSGALAFSGFNSSGNAAGSRVATLGLSQLCGGGAITLNPGDTFGIIGTLQSVSNRGGYTDATHTFRVTYDLANTVFADTGAPVGQAFLDGAITSDVPEPRTWALMVAGFGFAGAAVRRRQRAAVA